MINIEALKHEAFALTEEARKIHEKAVAEKRDFTPEEAKEYEAKMVEVDRLTEEIARESTLQNYPVGVVAKRIGEAGAETTEDEKRAKSKAFFNWIRHGARNISADERGALVEDTTGQILVPEDLDAEIIRSLGKISVMRNLATIRTTNRDRIRVRSLTEVSVGWGKLETGSVIPESTMVPSEAWQYVEDLYGLSKIGEDELMDSDANLQAILADSFARAIAEAEDTAFTIGTGHTYSQPAGVAVNAFIPTVNLDTADVITPDDMLDVMYELPAQYLSGASLLMNRKTEKVIRMFRPAVDAGYYGNYMWQPSLLVGQPSSFDGFPIYNQADMNYPADSVALKNEVIFGNFKAGYRIIDRMGITLQRLDELYAEAGLVGFKVHKRTGGGVIRTNAFRALINPS